MKVARGWRKVCVYLNQDVPIDRFTLWIAIGSMGISWLGELGKIWEGTSVWNRLWTWLRACP